jgi:hypothetical protein
VIRIQSCSYFLFLFFLVPRLWCHFQNLRFAFE